MKKEDESKRLWSDFHKSGVKISSNMLGKPQDYNLRVKSLIKNNTILGTIDFAPEYQRQYLHSGNKETEWRDWLLNTILEEGGINELSICRRDGKSYLTDGIQRLTTILNFITDKFAIGGILERDADGDMRVAQVEINNYQGMRFSKLPQDIQDRFLSYPVKVMLYDVENYSQELHLFDLLNRGATPVSQDHHLYVRTCGTELGKALIEFQKKQNGKFIMNPNVKGNRGRPVSTIPTRDKNYKILVDAFALTQDYQHNHGVSGDMRCFDVIKPEDVKDAVAHFNRTVETFRTMFCPGPENVTFWKRKNSETPYRVEFSKNIRVRNLLLAAIAQCDDHAALIKNRVKIIGKSAKNLDPKEEKSGLKGLFDCQRVGDEKIGSVSYASSPLFYNISISGGTSGLRDSALNDVINILKG
jgi:hypothetical protein